VKLLDRRNEEVNSESKRILALLCDLAKAANVSPKCYELKGIDPDKFGQVEASGGFADVYKHNYKNHVICLKAVRQSRQKSQNLKYLKVSQESASVYLFESADIGHAEKQAHIRELILWSRLRHENILPFYGVYFLENTARLCIISPWMENGNLRQFLEIFPAEPRHPFVSVNSIQYESRH
jgi:serine/threonine protein kinase